VPSLLSGAFGGHFPVPLPWTPLNDFARFSDTLLLYHYREYFAEWNNPSSEYSGSSIIWHIPNGEKRDAIRFAN